MGMCHTELCMVRVLLQLLYIMHATELLPAALAIQSTNTVDQEGAHTHRQTDKQRYGQTGAQADRQAGRQAGR